jgi:hypothetical protein
MINREPQTYFLTQGVSHHLSSSPSRTFSNHLDQLVPCLAFFYLYCSLEINRPGALLLFTFLATHFPVLFKMLLSTLTVLVAVAAKDVLAGYVLADDYMATDFFDQFSFWDTSDPTNGFVAYQSQDSAQTMGLINGTTGDIYMGVDSTNVTPDGRPSVRITSTKSYNYGLFVVDLEHMPGGICGTW